MNTSDGVRELVSKWYEARDKLDAKRLSALYHLQGTLILPEGNAVVGRGAIEAHYTAAFANGHLDRSFLNFGNLATFVQGDIAHLTLFARDRKQGTMHSFVDILRRTPGDGWQILVSSWTLTT